MAWISTIYWDWQSVGTTGWAYEKEGEGKGDKKNLNTNLYKETEPISLLKKMLIAVLNTATQCSEYWEPVMRGKKRREAHFTGLSRCVSEQFSML